MHESGLPAQGTYAATAGRRRGTASQTAVGIPPGLGRATSPHGAPALRCGVLPGREALELLDLI